MKVVCLSLAWEMRVRNLARPLRVELTLALEREARLARGALRQVVDCAEGDVIKRDRCVETPRTSNRKPAARVPPACELSGVEAPDRLALHHLARLDETAPLAFIDQPLADLDLPAGRAFVLWARARVEQPAQLRIGAPCVGRAAAAVSGRVGLLELACLSAFPTSLFTAVKSVRRRRVGRAGPGAGSAIGVSEINIISGCTRREVRVGVASPGAAPPGIILGCE